LLKHNNLMLRSEPRERLEAWATSDSPISHSGYSARDVAFRHIATFRCDAEPGRCRDLADIANVAARGHIQLLPMPVAHQMARRPHIVGPSAAAPLTRGGSRMCPICRMAGLILEGVPSAAL